MAGVVLEILQKFDNANNNDSTILAISLKPGWSFNAIHRRLRYFPHTLNLIGQLLLEASTLTLLTATARRLILLRRRIS
jgi:hypothetical protein